MKLYFAALKMVSLVILLVCGAAANANDTKGANDEKLRVVLLGTGSPIPSPTRYSQSILVEAGNQKILFDLGRGVTVRLAQLGISLSEVDASFITHMHSDHIVGLPDLWLTGWLATPFGSRKTPMRIFGPKGTKAMAAGLTQAFHEDIRIRELDEKLPPEGIAWDAHDIGPGTVYERNGLKVTAFASNHGPLIKPSLGYVIDYRGHKIVIPSDTRYDENISKIARNADLLIHEVAEIDPALLEKFPRLKEVAAHHTSPEDAGRIFSHASPRLAVYTHIVAFKKDRPLDLSTEDIVTRTRSTYSGPLVVGEDLMSFEVGDTIKVRDGKGNDQIYNDADGRQKNSRGEQLH